MKKSVEKSTEQAEIIKMIAVPINLLDVEYCKEIGSDMISQASRQETLAVLNPSYSLLKNDIIRKQGEALLTLCKYIDKLKEVDEMKVKLAKEQKNRDNISDIFL
jgi:hypothetical protein